MFSYWCPWLVGSIFYILGSGQALAWDLALEYGSGDEGIDRAGVGVQWRWSQQWLAAGQWYLGGYWEGSFSYWGGDKGRTGNDSLAEVGITPVFRFQRHVPVYGVLPYAEAAIGIHLLSEEHLGDRDFSIPFAFGSHLGVGIRFGTRGEFELGYRFQHLSNAGLEEPNPGINFHLVRLAYHF